VQKVADSLSEEAYSLATDQSLFRRMNDPVASAFFKGVCGDEMEFYLVIRNGVIDDASYHTDGCEITRACGALTVKKIIGRTVEEAMAINPKELTDELNPLPESHRHCPILAVITLYKAIADYLLQP